MIQQVAVIGSGVMGAGIAGQFANAGIRVYLFDIVPAGEKRRSILAEKAIERLLHSDPAPLMHPSKAQLIIPSNLEDDLHHLCEVDWIIEAIVERLDVKQALYQKVDTLRKAGCPVSSNTSTLPLHVLVEGMPESFQQDFLITHFFNPPRYMRLLELVGGPKTRPELLKQLHDFADITLGKGVVHCHDTPGFIANRIGCFWIQVALQEAINLGITVEEADAVMSKPLGIPKTGVFGLMDLIGLDLMPLIAKAFQTTLPSTDAFHEIYQPPALITRMINEGYTGRKGKGGFYRITKENGNKITETIDLQSGDYRPTIKAHLASVDAAKENLKSLLNHPDKGGQYARSVLLKTWHYVLSLVPEIADTIIDIDMAMRLGYNWKYGPFELIDRLGTETQSGTSYLMTEFEKAGMSIPPLLKATNGQPFYHIQADKKLYLTTQGRPEEIPLSKEAWSLGQMKLKHSPVFKGAATLWDVGDGVACLELTTKMNSIDPSVLTFIQQTIEKVSKEFRALMIGGDTEYFCAGANLGFLLYAANMAAWNMIEDVIDQGQKTYMALKYAPFPVVSAPSGMALGGGCEMLLHSDAIQAHAETYTGLVEVGVGVIPGWGGCKELLLRQLQARQEADSLTSKMGKMFSFIPVIKGFNTMPAILKTFETIAFATVSKSAHHAQDMKILNSLSHITMNRDRLLADAKKLALTLAQHYSPPTPATIYLPGKTAKTAMEMGLKSYVKSGKASEHDALIGTTLAHVLSGGTTDIHTPLSEQHLLDLEKAGFMELIKHPKTLARIEHMLELGKPLRN